MHIVLFLRKLVRERKDRKLLNYDVIVIYAQLLQTHVKEHGRHLKSVCSNMYVVWTEIVFVWASTVREAYF